MKDSAVLLIDCPDRKGLVARVSGLLFERGANILHADQHIGTMAWACFSCAWSGSWTASTSTGFQAAAFAALASDLGMTVAAGTSSARRPRVALFCSQYLHCMADLLHRWRTGELVCEIPVIVSNHRAVEKLGGVLRRAIRARAGDG
jgi:formyltetrahydrofolate deformylase